MTALFFLPNLHAAGAQTVPSRLPSAVRRLPSLGAYAPTNQMNLAFGLPLRDPEGLTNLLRQISDPSSPNYHHYLTPEQFTERFGPTEKDYQAVIDFARAHGLRVTGAHQNRMLVDAQGSVPQVEKALHISMQVYQHPTERRLFHAPSTEPSLDLDVPLLGISGLDDYARAEPCFHPTPQNQKTPLAAPTGSGPDGTLMGGDFRAAYLPNCALNGAGQTIGFVEFDGYHESDVAAYEAKTGLPSISISNILIDGASGQPAGTGGDVEVCLDIELAQAMATNLSKVIIYEGPPSTPWIDVFNRVANDNKARQVCCCWFQPGLPQNPVADQIFEQMIAQGQSLFCSSGDYDALEGLIGFPDDSPYATMVGATTLTTSGPLGSWVAETVWNWDTGLGSSGGVSTQYPIPEWQQDVSMADNEGSATMRNIPDVACVGDNIYVRAENSDFNLGGTSCAAPMWAALAAMANQLAASRGEPPVGFLNPAIYAIGDGPGYPSLFHDITAGNNLRAGIPDRFYAVAGYDLCTGWGTPAGTNLFNALVSPAFSVVPGAGFHFVGAVGGPFGVAPETFTLTNVGVSPVGWALGGGAPWLSISTHAGTLQPAGPSTAVTISLNTNAANLGPGIYNATLWFTNLASGLAEGRAFSLDLGFPPVIDIQPISQELHPGVATGLFVDITNSGPVTYQWQFNGTNIPNNIINTLAGNGNADFGGDGGLATNASLASPFGAAVDSQGNIFLADFGNSRVRKIDVHGVITTVAGNGVAGFSGDGGPATNASLNIPYSVAVDAAGNLFISDLGNDRIRKVATNGLITTVAGNGDSGFSGDGGPATNASLGYPYGLAMDAAGDLFLADFGNSSIRKVDTNGIITTVAGNGAVGFAGDHSYATNASLYYPLGVAVDASGNVFIADLGNERIRKVDRAGIISTVAGDGSLGYSGDDGGATNASLNDPYSVAVDNSGDIFIADLGNDRVRGVDGNGLISTVAGDNIVGYSGDGGAATNASLNDPYGVAVDSAGNLLIADTDNNRLRQVGLAGSPTLTLPVFSTNNAGGYTVVIRNTWGSVTSSVAALSVATPPQITAQPASLLATNGHSVSLSVSATGSLPLYYQWRENGTNLGNLGEFSGAGASNLVINPATTNDTANYTVIVSNSFGVVTSGVATLTVAWPPLLLSQPVSVLVTNNAATGFTVAVSGQGPLSYQWQKDGVNLSDGGEFVGSLTTNLTVNPATTNDNGAYVLVVSNVWGSATSSVARLAIALPPAIKRQPQSVTIINGTTAQFNVAATGTAPLSAQWRKDGLNLLDTGEVSGSLTTNLLISPATTNDIGSYTLVLSNAWGAITSSVAALDIAFAPVITNQPQSLILTNAATANFFVGAAGTAPLVFQWQANSNNLSDLAEFAGTATTNLSITPAGTNDSAAYTVIVSNAYGIVTSSVATLTVAAAPLILSQPQSTTVLDGGSSGFAVQAIGDGPLFYQWRLNETNLIDSGEFTGSAATNLQVNPVAGGDAGAYTVIISNAYGVVTSAVANLTVAFPPAITNQPQSVTLMAGGAGSFTVGATGTAPLFVQWQKNGLTLFDSGEINGSLTTNLLVSPATTNDIGAYTAVISNAYGVVTSSPASLSIALPPIVTNQPRSLVVAAGSSASLFIGASGTGPLLYEWRLNGTNLDDLGEFSGSATTNLLIAPTSTNDAGNYTVVVSNALGAVTSSVALLTIATSPIIVAPPQDLTAAVGNPASFEVTAVGVGPLFYQWQLDSTNLTDVNEFSGSTATNLLVNPVTSNDLSSYTVIVSNAYGVVTSSAAILTVVEAPSIVTQPQDFTVIDGGAALFAANATGTAPLYFQWRLDGTNLADGGEFVGSWTTNLFIIPATTADAGNYTLVVSNAWGSVTSAPAALSIEMPPDITNQPQSLIAAAGAPAQFSVGVSGTGPFFYQWQLNQTNLGNTGPFSGALAKTLAISSATTNDIGAYTVLVRNAWGSATSAVATLAIGAPPVISNEPRSVILLSGAATNFSVGASGTAPLAYQWRANGVNLADGAEFTGASTSNLLVGPATTNDAVNYTVVVSNAFGVLTSSVATLSIAFPPAITNQPQSLVVAGGAPASFLVGASGTDPFSYQWRLNGTNLTDGAEFTGSLSTNLLVAAAASTNAGSYTVVVTSAWGAVTSAVATLTIGQPPVITNQPQSVILLSGGAANFSVGVSGTAPLLFQWQTNQVNLADGAEFNGSTTTNLTVSPATTNDAVNYSVLVSNAYGVVTSAVAALTIAYPPQILTQPAGFVAIGGEPASLNVAASGTAPLSYRWQRNGDSLPHHAEFSGTLTTNLLISAVTTNDAGAYTVIVSNSWGIVTSAVANVTVVLRPVITNQPQSVALLSGGRTGFSVGATGTPPLFFQWQTNQANLADGAEFSGSATTNLVVSPAATNDALNYTVIVSNAYGVVTSAVATLTIAVPPQILDLTHSFTIVSGAAANFGVVASGTAPLFYQWLQNGQTLFDAGEFSGSTTTNLAISPAAPADDANYSVIVSNAWGAVTSSIASLTVALPPVITNQPQGDVVALGDATSFAVGATGNGPLFYQWQLNATNLTDGGAFSGSTTTNLAITGVATNDAGNYTVIVSNAWGVVTSSVAALTVATAPIIVTQPQGMLVGNGGAASFNVGAVGVGPLLYQWRLNSNNLADANEFAGSAASNLLVNPALTNDAGNYTVVVSNAYGSVTSAVAALDIALPPSIAAQPQNALVPTGSAASFTVAIAGTGPLSYQWLRNGHSLVDGSEFSGSATSNLMVNPATTNDVAGYSVIVTNAWGAITSQVAILTIAFPPVITNQPQSLVVANGDPASFIVQASGAEPMFFRWQINSTNLVDTNEFSGSFATNLVISPALTNDAAAYTVVVSNAWGVATSSVATLTIATAPIIVAQPQSALVTNGAPARFNVLAVGVRPLLYQWQFGANNIIDTNEFSGSLTSNLFINPVGTNDVGSYTVIVSNAYGIVTSSVAALAIGTPPVILSQPQDLSITAGFPVGFSVAVSGTAPIAYQWQFNQTNLTDGGELTGSTSSNLVIAAISDTNAGSYAVVISNALGCVTSAIATLTVLPPPIPDHFTWAQVPSPRFVGASFPVSLSARDTNNQVITNFIGFVFLDSTNGVAVVPSLATNLSQIMPVSPAVISNFVQGVWSGRLLIAQTATNLVFRANDGLGHIGLANPINVILPPSLTQRISGSMLQFVWPAGYAGFVLVSSPTLQPGSWTPAPIAPFRIGNQFLGQLPAPGSNTFYRLELVDP